MKRTIGIDVGLNHFYTDSDGNTVENSRHLRRAEKRLKRAQRRASKKVKDSKNRRKAVKRLGKAHLKLQRQRRDFAVKTARCGVKSNDFVALEDLWIRNMVKNRHLAKSVSDAAWGEFRRWVEISARYMGLRQL
jgi:putative transposase